MDTSYRPARRRSIPRLPEFSITPLRTHIDNSLADEHGTHSYSQPQTPRSPRSAFHSPSHTPTVLSRAPSRDPSRSGGRRRKVKSALLLADLERPLIAHAKASAVAEDIARDGKGHLSQKSRSSLRLQKVQTDVPAHPMKGHTPKSKSMAGITSTGRRSSSNNGQGPDWLLSTASILAMNSAEYKGQSWLATKSASTSLVGTPYIEKDEFTFRPLTKNYDGGEDLLSSPQTSRPGSRRNSLPGSAGMSRPKSRGGSRTNSRMGSRLGSRVNLANVGLSRKTPGAGTDAERRSADYFNSMSVEFADDYQAIADDEDEDGDSGSDLDECEEGELKKLVWGRVGGWVDWAVGWMDWRDGLEGLDDSDEERVAEEKNVESQDVDAQKLQKRKRRVTIKQDPSQDEITDAGTSGTSLPPPPPGEQAGVVNDAKWLMGVVGKLIV